MKRIETVEDVKKAMELNNCFYGYVMKLNETDREAVKETNEEYEEEILKKCKSYMAEAVDTANTLAALYLYASGLKAKISEGIKAIAFPSVDDSIEHYLENNDMDGEPFYNLVIDDDKVYRLYENFCEHEDKTFVTRQEFYVSDEDGYTTPIEEYVGWYYGSPSNELTNIQYHYNH